MAQGLMSRLKDELIALLKTEVYKEKLHTYTVKFHRVPAKENFAAWYVKVDTFANFMILSIFIVFFLFQGWAVPFTAALKCLKQKDFQRKHT